MVSDIGTLNHRARACERHSGRSSVGSQYTPDWGQEDRVTIDKTSPAVVVFGNRTEICRSLGERPADLFNLGPNAEQIEEFEAQHIGELAEHPRPFEGASAIGPKGDPLIVNGLRP